MARFRAKRLRLQWQQSTIKHVLHISTLNYTYGTGVHYLFVQMVKNAAHEDRELGLVYRVDDIDGLGKPAKESERVQQQSRNK